MTFMRLMILLLCALALQACQTFVPQAPLEGPIVDESQLANPNNIIALVETSEEASALVLGAVRRGYNLDQRSVLPGLEMVMLEFTRPDNVSGIVAIRDLKAISPGATAGVEHIFTLQLSTNKGGTPRIYAPKMMSWPDKGCEAHLSIGIIDGAVNTETPALQGRNVVIRDFVGDSVAKAEAHGTAIAELLIGPGRLQDARLYSASVVSDYRTIEGAGVYELILAINWMLESDVQVVNFSLAGPYNALLDHAVQRAAKRGMIIVAAVGNDGPNAAPRYPAAFKDVIAVTAVDSAKKVFRDAVRGRHVEYSAPGVDIFLSGGPSENYSGTYQSGTSLAAPSVTAIIASDAEISKNSQLSFVREQLASNSIDLGATGFDSTFGNGLSRASVSCRGQP